MALSACCADSNLSAGRPPIHRARRDPRGRRPPQSPLERHPAPARAPHHAQGRIRRREGRPPHRRRSAAAGGRTMGVIVASTRLFDKADSEERSLRLAVLIDADNAQATVIEGLLAEIARFGEATVKRIYGDFTAPASSSWKKVLQRYGFPRPRHPAEGDRGHRANLYRPAAHAVVPINKKTPPKRGLLIATQLREAPLNAPRAF